MKKEVREEIREQERLLREEIDKLREIKEQEKMEEEKGENGRSILKS